MYTFKVRAAYHTTLAAMEFHPSTHHPIRLGRLQGLCGCFCSRLQVAPCSLRYRHDWSQCPYAHAGERARRRDPKTSVYSAIACRWVVGLSSIQL